MRRHETGCQGLETITMNMKKGGEGGSESREEREVLTGGWGRLRNEVQHRKWKNKCNRINTILYSMTDSDEAWDCGCGGIRDVDSRKKTFFRREEALL
jgi:hypothetical protein